MDASDNFSGEEIEAVRAHLAKFKNHVCPVCGTKKWSLTPPQTLLHYQHERWGLPSTIGEGPSIPVVLVICQTCFHVRSFAWRPIWEAYLASHGGLGLPTTEGGRV